MNKLKFWNWIKTESERVLELNGTIAEESWFNDDITPRLFKEELFSETGDVIIWLNSPGGDCLAASTIYTALMDYPGNVTVKIDSLAASAASVIAMAANKVLMSPTALLMIHNPMTSIFGNKSEFKKALHLLDEVKESIVNAYELKTGLTREKISSLMDAETWLSSTKAIELGFADGLLDKRENSKAQDSYSFSAQKLENKIINKISDKPISGTSIASLEKRLALFT